MIDPATAAATRCTGQQQVSVQATVAALDPDQSDVVVAEDRARASSDTGVDAVMRGGRRS